MEPRLNNRYVLCKPDDGRKIDLAVCSVLADEAFGDATAAGEWPKKKNRTITVYR